MTDKTVPTGVEFFCLRIIILLTHRTKMYPKTWFDSKTDFVMHCSAPFTDSWTIFTLFGCVNQFLFDYDIMVVFGSFDVDHFRQSFYCLPHTNI